MRILSVLIRRLRRWSHKTGVLLNKRNDFSDKLLAGQHQLRGVVERSWQGRNDTADRLGDDKVLFSFYRPSQICPSPAIMPTSFA